MVKQIGTRIPIVCGARHNCKKNHFSIVAPKHLQHLEGKMPVLIPRILDTGQTTDTIPETVSETLTANQTSIKYIQESSNQLAISLPTRDIGTGSITARSYCSHTSDDSSSASSSSEPRTPLDTSTSTYVTEYLEDLTSDVQRLLFLEN